MEGVMALGKDQEDQMYWEMEQPMLDLGLAVLQQGMYSLNFISLIL